MTYSNASHRLPRIVLPKHYDLTIQTDLLRQRFKGCVRISVDIIEKTDTIHLHATNSLTLFSTSFTSTTSSCAATPRVVIRTPEYQRLAYTFQIPFDQNTSGVLEIAFEGDLASNLLGYYKCSWNGGVYAATQFEPIEARTAFPCFDEPALKATFAFTSITRANTVSLANMPARSVSTAFDMDLWGLEKCDDDSWVKTVFETTPPMSTYILAYANGPFRSVEDSYTSTVSQSSKLVRVWATPELLDNAQITLNLLKRALPMYEVLFDLEMPLPKMDVLVVSESDVGSMENWGLIISRPDGVLAAEGDGNAERYVCANVSHELAHQWFGNATTMAWWDSLFLNEGFASLMGELIVLGRLFSAWDAEAGFVHGRFNGALRLDAQRVSHPVFVPISQESKIKDAFDELSYGKAASVLRMLSTHLGQASFLRGVTLYLKRHQFANAEPTDLWGDIGESCGIDVAGLIQEWITATGFPVVYVSVTDAGIEVRQDRFFADGQPVDGGGGTIWSIPLALLTLDSSASIVGHPHVFKTRSEHINLASPLTTKLNANTSGFFRVYYSPEHLRSLLSFAQTMSSLDAIGIIQDACALAAAGLYSMGQVMDLLQTFGKRVEFTVQRSVADGLDLIEGTWWNDDSIMSKLDALRAKQFGHILEAIGYEYDPIDDYATTQLRTLAISQMACAHQPRVQKLLAEWFELFMHDPENGRVNAGALFPVLSNAVRQGDQTVYDAVFELYQKSSDPGVHNAAAQALGATQSLPLIDRSLEEALTGALAPDAR